MKTVLLLIGFTLVSVHFAEAQQAAKVPRIGWLSGGDANSTRAQVEGFRHGLRELGYVDGKNIVLDYRWAEGNSDQYPVLAGELVQLRADVIVTSGTQATVAAKHATKAIPIVVGGAGDLIGGRGRSSLQPE